jgi:hypothetical protein
VVLEFDVAAPVPGEKRGWFVVIEFRPLFMIN